MKKIRSVLSRILLVSMMVSSFMFNSTASAVQLNLYDTSITLSSYLAGESPIGTIKLTSPLALPAGGKIKITFPNDYLLGPDPAGASSCNNFGLGGGFTSSVFNQTITIVSNNGVINDSPIECNIDGFFNPRAALTTGTFTFQTTDAADVVLNEDLAVPGVNITPNVLSNTSVVLASYKVGDTTTATATFTLTNSLMPDDEIHVVFPWDFQKADFFDLSNATVQNCNLNGAVSSSVSGYNVTISRDGNGLPYPNNVQINCKISGVKNLRAGTTDKFGLYTSAKNGGTRDQDWNVNSVTLVTPLNPPNPIPQIVNFSVNPSTFSPNGDGQNDTTTISFKTDIDAFITLTIMSGSNPKNTLINHGLYNPNQKSLPWDGLDKDGNLLANGTYRVHLEADNANGANDEYVDVTIDNTNSVPPNHQCAGFKDVLDTDPKCPAITYVKNAGIFEGYPDGTFQLAKVINRVETTKVTLIGFNKTILAADGTKNGFKDVKIGEWYMPYVRTAKALGILQGYPDGTLKPEQQIIRVEMLKVFFKTSAEDLANLVVNLAPYKDTPIETGTAWYIKFVQFVKDHALVDADTNGYFHPSAGMTRGDVAELFYRYNQYKHPIHQ